MDADATAPLRAAVRMCRRSVRAGAFACELAARRWLGPCDARWIAQNLAALRGIDVEVCGEPPRGADALVIAEPSGLAGFALLATVPLASIGPSLVDCSEPWWPRAGGAPVLLSTRDGDDLARLAAMRARIVPVGVCAAALGSGVTRARLRFGAPIELDAAAGWSAAARARDEIERVTRAA
jgi:hypothetical protein